MTMTENDRFLNPPLHRPSTPSSHSCKQCVKIAFTYIVNYQALTPFLPSYSDKNLLSPLKFCIFAPAIEGTAYCAENRSSIKTGAGLK